MKLYYFYLFIMRYLFYFLHLVGSNRTLDTFCLNESKNNNKKATFYNDENFEKLEAHFGCKSPYQRNDSCIGMQ